MMRTIVVLTMLVCLAGSGAAGADAQGKCVPGTRTAEQQERRREGLRIARLVNTAQANHPGAASKKYLTQADLAKSPYLQQRLEGQDAFVTPLNFKAGEEVMPGWELKVDVTQDGYWFMVRDKTDACGFAYISNQNGVIYTAEPIR